jgi:phosphoglycerate kinase
LLKDTHLALPVDSLVVNAGGVQNPANARIASLDGVKSDEMMLDHGPKTIEELEHFIKKSKTILWNGPLGEYELGFVESTNAVAKAIAKSGADSYLGGGDTEAAIAALHLEKRFSFVSTGGGAMLDFLAKGTLPGIKVLR